jgi:hypothetical protein
MTMAERWQDVGKLGSGTVARWQQPPIGHYPAIVLRESGDATMADTMADFARHEPAGGHAVNVVDAPSGVVPTSPAGCLPGRGLPGTERMMAHSSPEIRTRLVGFSDREWQQIRAAAQALSRSGAEAGTLILPGRPEVYSLRRAGPEFELRLSSERELAEMLRQEPRADGQGHEQTPSRCRVCGDSRPWRDLHGVLKCATCHPPAGEDVVSEWPQIEVEEDPDDEW